MNPISPSPHPAPRRPADGTPPAAAARPATRSARRAFTIVELLVVIAVISILVGMLMPLIRSVRRQAKALHCLNGVGQCAKAVQLYIEEYHGNCMPWIPTYGCYCDPPHGNRWHTSIHWLIQEYLQDDKVWECPADDTHDCYPWDGNYMNGGDRYTGTRRRCGFHYNNGGGVNGGIFGVPEQGLSRIYRVEGTVYCDEKCGKRADSFAKASKKIATFCWCGHNFWPGAGPNRERLQWWHSDPPDLKCPVGFLDGHGAIVVIKPYRNETPEYMW